MKHTTQNHINQLKSKLRRLAWSYGNIERDIVYNYNSYTITKLDFLVNDMIYISKQVYEFSKELKWYELYLRYGLKD